MYIPQLRFQGDLVFFSQAGAIAAGNAVAIKASESTPATTALMNELVEKYLDKDLVRFINGAVPETTRVRLIDSKWRLANMFFFSRSWNYSGITVSPQQKMSGYKSNFLLIISVLYTGKFPSNCFYFNANNIIS